jgi:hypothetical protein
MDNPGRALLALPSSPRARGLAGPTESERAPSAPAHEWTHELLTINVSA